MILSKVHIKAFLVVTFFLSFLFWLAWDYKDYFSADKSIPKSFEVLNKLEKTKFTLKGEDLRGESFTLSQYRNKIVLVNFWSPTCAPCLKEFPSLLRLINHFKGELFLVAVATLSEKEDVEVFLKQNSLKSPFLKVLYDRQGRLGKEFGIRALPVTFLVGPQGRLIRQVLGEETWDTPEAFSFFRALLPSES